MQGRRPVFSTESSRPYFYEYSVLPKCVSVSRGANRAGGTPFDPAAGSISGLARATKTGGQTRHSVQVAILMKLPGLWILGAFAAGIGIAERWPESPRLWAAVAASGILLGGILAAGFLSWRHCAAVAWVCALLA